MISILSKVATPTNFALYILIRCLGVCTCKQYVMRLDPLSQQGYGCQHLHESRCSPVLLGRRTMGDIVWGTVPTWWSDLTLGDGDPSALTAAIRIDVRCTGTP